MKNKNRNSELELILINSDLKITPTRLKILDILEGTKIPVSINDIIEQCSECDMDQATVYRIIKTFLRKKIIRQLELKHRHAYFELLSKKHHHHIICEKCSKIVKIEQCNVQNIEDKVLKLSGFKSIDSHSLKFYGLCKNCS